VLFSGGAAAARLLAAMSVPAAAAGAAREAALARFAAALWTLRSGVNVRAPLPAVADALRALAAPPPPAAAAAPPPPPPRGRLLVTVPRASEAEAEAAARASEAARDARGWWGEALPLISAWCRAELLPRLQPPG